MINLSQGDQLTKYQDQGIEMDGVTRGLSINVCYGRSSYCGIHPVLWDGQLLCFEMIEDKSSITDVVETCMKVI